jgi:hypothetical protein
MLIAASGSGGNIGVHKVSRLRQALIVSEAELTGD